MKINLINPVIKNDFGRELLKLRGIKDIDWYLNPTTDIYLNDFYNLDNIEKGAEELNKAIKSDKKILICVDCDNDGFTSSAIMYQYIKHLNPNKEIDYWLHKGKQHGLEDHIEHLLEEEDNYSLLIMPDASSNDYEYHSQLKIPVLVLDHHLAEGPYAENAIIINNQLSERYTNKDLTGAGVVWQFCRYLDSLNGDNYAEKLIDLAAWGIIGDMGSILSMENRYIISKGLSNIKNFFFKTLVDKQSYSMGDNISYISVAFYIVPLTNAMIRIGTMEEKQRLFMAYIDGTVLVPSKKRGANGKLEMVAIESARECTNARTHQNKMRDEIVEKLEIKIHKYDLLSNKILFVRLDDDDVFPSELTGLIAMQLSAKFKKPTIVARLNPEGYDKGSIRGLNQSELSSFKNYLDSTGMFEYVQGHDNAAGCSIKDEYLNSFHLKANSELKDIDFGESVYDVNFSCIAADATYISDLIFDLDTYSNIWGQNNSEPLIHVSDLNVTKKDIQIMGKNSDTVKITKFGIAYIKFHAKDFIQELSEHEEVQLEIVGRANLNEWGGRYTPQIFIENYEVKDGTLSF